MSRPPGFSSPSFSSSYLQKPYNFGGCGYRANVMKALLESPGNLPKILLESPGILTLPKCGYPVVDYLYFFRKKLYKCVCGILFKDQTTYYLHKSSHSSENPKKCSFCAFIAQDWYSFMTHFFSHKKA